MYIQRNEQRKQKRKHRQTIVFGSHLKPKIFCQVCWVNLLLLLLLRF